MEYNFHWAGKQQMEMLMQPLPPTWGKYSPHTIATWASSLFRCKVRCSLLFTCLFFPRWTPQRYPFYDNHIILYHIGVI